MIDVLDNKKSSLLGIVLLYLRLCRGMDVNLYSFVFSDFHAGRISICLGASWRVCKSWFGCRNGVLLVCRVAALAVETVKKKEKKPSLFD